MPRTRAPKSALLTLARHKVGVPVFLLLLLPFVLAAAFATLSASLSLRPALAWPPLSRGLRDEARSAAARERAHLQTAAAAAVPECARAGRAHSFVLLFMGHSGSTAMISALQQHDEVLVRHYEPLDHALGNDGAAALRYADRFFAEARKAGKVGGFKMRPRHILRSPDKWAAMFRKHDTRVIWNFRGNVFKQAVGHYPIRFLNDSTRYEGIPITARKKKSGSVESFHIHDMEALHTLLQERIRGETHVELACARAGSGRCVLPVSYERFLRDARMEILRIQAFLGVGLGQELVPGRRKATKDNLCEVVRNWDDVCEAFYGCQRWRGMMEDLDNGCTCRNVTVDRRARWHRFCFRDSARMAYQFSGVRFQPGAS